MLSPYTNTALEMAQKIKLHESICHKYFLYKKALREREAEQFKIKFEEMSPEVVLKAKTEAIKAQAHNDEMFAQAIAAMKEYSGFGRDDTI